MRFRRNDGQFENGDPVSGAHDDVSSMGTRDGSGELIASYQYDPFGRRIRKTVTREWNKDTATWHVLPEA